MTTITKDTIINLLDKWIAQRAGLEFANYGDVSAYRSESRRITQQGKDARVLLAYVQRSQITAEELREAFRAFSGRLQLVETPKGWRLDYCTGQYFPTEYRAAAAAVLAAAIWSYIREDYKNDDHAGDSIRAAARRIFGRSIASRWFN